MSDGQHRRLRRVRGQGSRRLRPLPRLPQSGVTRSEFLPPLQALRSTIFVVCAAMAGPAAALKKAGNKSARGSDRSVWRSRSTDGKRRSPRSMRAAGRVQTRRRRNGTGWAALPTRTRWTSVVGDAFLIEVDTMLAEEDQPRRLRPADVLARSAEQVGIVRVGCRTPSARGCAHSQRRRPASSAGARSPRRPGPQSAACCA